MSKDKIQEGKANEAETVASVTPQEGADAAMNEAEAADDAKKRRRAAKEADAENYEDQPAMPPNHNTQCRRITAMLRQSRGTVDVNTLRDENQKLKTQIRRMQAEQAAPSTDRPTI